MGTGSDEMSAGCIAAAIGGCIAAFVLLIFVIAVLVGTATAWDSTTAGSVAVIRNGGPFSNSNIRGHIDPASSLTWTGIWSTTHHYPAQQQYYTISANPDAGNQLGVDVDSTLGGDYLTGIRFNLSQVDLPAPVQAEVDQAQAAYAAVSEAEAQKAQATITAEANEIKEQGYADCPACAQIAVMQAIPPSITTFAPGAGFSITSK